MANPHFPVITAEQLTHRYGPILALDSVDLLIPGQCKVGLIGPDGVGKSTLMGLLAGSRKLQAGTVRVLGGSMADGGHRRWACPRIAFMPQGLGRNLYMELSVLENLDFIGRLFGQSPRERSNRIEWLTHATGLEGFLGRPAGKLSGGMKQKLGLCCALIHDPDLLLLDEPTTGVDPLSRRQFWDLIDRTCAERPELSVVVSTAYMEEAERFDWLVAMDAGRVLTTGAPGPIKARHGVTTLEQAFVALLPEGKRGLQGSPVVPPRSRDGDETPVIIAEHLTCRFGAFTAVADANFRILRGEIFGFLGSNGCGKTTTMKMLTGLLPATDGKAWLFGKPVAANRLEIRRRVGYMSQHFSLYGELTVLQNLRLHAHLFSLPAKAADARLAELVRRFGLADYLGELAEQLPLGVRQRLSLAAALIHGPELLILDEPTSGVDPVARDEFWRFLTTLSRQDRVTIFISTHFMTEAIRCDRISLMHAGKVLAQGTPAGLQAELGAASLEDAFVAHIQAAIGAPAAVEARVPALPVQASPRMSSRFSARRLLAHSHREFQEVLRDPVRLSFAFLGSAVLFVVFGFGIDTDVEHIRFAVLDLDQTPQSRAYGQALAGTGSYFLEQPPLVSPQEATARMRARDISVAIELPPAFGRDLARAAQPQVTAWVDGANPWQAETIRTYLEEAHRSILDQLDHGLARAVPTVPAIAFQPRFKYNPGLESIHAMVPGTMALLLVLIPAILMAVSVVREKELGSIVNFFVTPATRFEFLLGKQLPYILIGMLNFALLVTMSFAIFQVPIKGSLLALTAGTALYVAATTGFGLLVSALTSSQVTAVIGTAIVSLLVGVQFSGMIQPVSTLKGGARLMGGLWPTTYYMHASVGTFTKALGFAGVSRDLLVLAVFALGFLLLSAVALRKQER